MPVAGDTPAQGRYRVAALLVLSEIASSLSTEATLAGSVRLLTPDGGQLRLVSSVGLPPEMVERERLVARDCGVCGESIQGARPTWSGEPRVCRGMNPGAFVPGCGEVIAVPLQHRGAVHGVYNLFLAQGRPLSDDVRLLFGAISEHLEVALENTHLARAERYLAEMEDALEGGESALLDHELAYILLRDEIPEHVRAPGRFTCATPRAGSISPGRTTRRGAALKAAPN